ncbi:MAG: hypothetical protein F6K42_39235, partial [Leptolyngbya sp. SIO1D8]|nr:hypothetical protein [Leptolyngbya sp. SIO1D8]
MSKVSLTHCTNRFKVHRGSGSGDRSWGGVAAASCAARSVSSKPWATALDKGGSEIRVTDIDNFPINVPPTRHMLFTLHRDM